MVLATHIISVFSFSIFSTIVLFLFFSPGESIRCYDCNSHNDSECAANDLPPELEKNCTSNDTEINYILCRKIVQTIVFELGELEPGSRVMRSCGWDDSKHSDSCYRRSGYKWNQEICSCKTDLCNAACAPSRALGALAAALGLVLARHAL